MQIDQIRAFLRAVEEPSLRRAAAGLHLSQPALSGRIAALEQSLGVRLLHRGPHGSRISSDGQRLLPLMQQALQAFDRLSEAAAEVRRVPNGAPLAVRLGLLIDGVEALTWPIVQAVHQWRPAPMVQLRPLVWAEVNDALLTGQVDAVLARGPWVDHRLRVSTLAWGQVGVILTSRHPLAAASALDLRTVAELPTLRPPPGVCEAFSRFWLIADLRPHGTVMLPEKHGVREMVEHANRWGLSGLFPAALRNAVVAAGGAYRPLTEPLRCPLQVLTVPGQPVGAAVDRTAQAVARQLVPLLPSLDQTADGTPGTVGTLDPRVQGGASGSSATS